MSDPDRSGSDAPAAAGRRLAAPLEFTAYLLLGLAFGYLLVRAEIVSWFRIQEMFRFHSFHMYGILGSGVVTAAVLLEVLRRGHARSATGERIYLVPKELGRGTRYWAGGTLFGLGWALTGACPGPIVALLGSGVTVISVVMLSALAGTWLYALLRSRLPH